MPIYEYECRKCGGRFEQLIRRDADIPRACPKCGAKSPKKVFSAFSVAASEAHAASACESCPTGSCPMRAGGGCCDD